MIIARKFGVKRLILFGSAVELPETARERLCIKERPERVLYDMAMRRELKF
ncbi:hypothetical protein KJ640_06840 [bacterium]|nr:hypothetical protein [bacterium]